MGINAFFNVGDRIKKERLKRGISQKDFAQKLGIPTTTLSGYENSAREPSEEVINACLKEFGMSNIFELISGKTAHRLTEKIHGLGGYIWMIDQDDVFTVGFPKYNDSITLTKDEVDYLNSVTDDFLRFLLDNLYRNKKGN